MSKDDKKARAGERVFKELKITLTFTPAEWVAMRDDFLDMKRQAEDGGQAYSWDDYVDTLRLWTVSRVRHGLAYRRGMAEVRRARAAGYRIPDAVIQ